MSTKLDEMKIKWSAANATLEAVDAELRRLALEEFFLHAGDDVRVNGKIGRVSDVHVVDIYHRKDGSVMVNIRPMIHTFNKDGRVSKIRPIRVWSSDVVEKISLES